MNEHDPLSQDFAELETRPGGGGGLVGLLLAALLVAAAVVIVAMAWPAAAQERREIWNDHMMVGPSSYHLFAATLDSVAAWDSTRIAIRHSDSVATAKAQRTAWQKYCDSVDAAVAWIWNLGKAPDPNPIAKESLP
jgi:hypothetical protein